LVSDDGAFAEYIVAKGDLQLRIPKDLSFEKATTLPLGVAAVMQGLYQKGLKIKLPNDPVKEKTFLLIYNRSTATSSLSVQCAKLYVCRPRHLSNCRPNRANRSGYVVLATCSTKHFGYVKCLGADELFDYRDSTVGSKIREFTQNKLKLVWDTVSQKESAKICTEALSSESAGCLHASFLSNKSPKEDVVSVGTNMYTIFGDSFTVG
jgi:NADPH:quinone reductase-like Zn-dependent oxidoreductase